MKKLLLIKGSQDIEDSEIWIIQNICLQYNLECIRKDIITNADLDTVLADATPEYDYMYLATHWCEASWWSSGEEGVSVTWESFSQSLCASDIMKQGSILFHSCCKWWLNQVCYTMFSNCNKLDYICWPRQNVYPIELTTAFSLFIYYIEVKNIDPVRSAEKVLQATDVRFVCHDRLEVITTTDYCNFACWIRAE